MIGCARGSSPVTFPGSALPDNSTRYLVVSESYVPQDRCDARTDIDELVVIDDHELFRVEGGLNIE